MSLGEWQIIATITVGVLAPVGAAFAAARFAVGNLRVERDHARLDELRTVLDEGAAQIATCLRAEIEAVAATVQGTADDPSEKLAALDAEIQPLIGLVGRVALRVDNDPLMQALHRVVVQLQAIRKRCPPPFIRSD
jgi:hypothetical protein